MRTEEQKQEILRLYYKAIEVVKANPHWASGRTIPLTEGVINDHKVKIWLKNEMGHIRLWLFEEGNTGSQMDRKYWKYELAYDVPVDGWCISANEKSYLD